MPNSVAYQMIPFFCFKQPKTIAVLKLKLIKVFFSQFSQASKSKNALVHCKTILVKVLWISITYFHQSPLLKATFKPILSCIC